MTPRQRLRTLIRGTTTRTAAKGAVAPAVAVPGHGGQRLDECQPAAAMQPVPDAIAELRATLAAERTRLDVEAAALRRGRSWVAMEEQRRLAQVGALPRDARGRFVAASRGSEGDGGR